MKVLFIHQNFPGQFKHLAPALMARGHQVRALAIDGVGLQVLQPTRYKIGRSSTAGIHPWSIDFESRMIRAESCRGAMLGIKREDFEPDLIVTHPGWGESLLAKEIFPAARQLHFVEWFYHSVPSANPDVQPQKNSMAQDLGRNAINLLALEQMDWGYTPTQWQRQQLPPAYRDRISVVHDGIDTDHLIPDPSCTLTFHRAGVTLGQKDELVTFVNRNLEPSRGWHTFARSLPKLMRERPQAHVVIIGGDGASYGGKPEAGTWRSIYWDEIKNDVDVSRIHFLGRVPYATFVKVLQASSCHVYLTGPFFLSWSMLEAMSLGCVVVGSDTAPVQEVIRHGENGLLTPLADPAVLADVVARVLADPEAYRPLRAAARDTVVHKYDLKKVCLPAQLQLVDRVMRGDTA